MSRRSKTTGIKVETDPSSRFSAAQKRVIERVKKMTIEEGVKTLVASGIYTADGKLAREYGGKG